MTVIYSIMTSKAIGTRQLLGITVNKATYTLTEDDYVELKYLDIIVKETISQYILTYHGPGQSDQSDQPGQVYSSAVIRRAKNNLKRVRNDTLYNSYNDDFGIHRPFAILRGGGIIKN